MEPQARSTGRPIRFLPLSMGTGQAREIYQERAAAAECCNAQVRNRGLRQFGVRGLDKLRNVARWHGSTHDMVCTRRLTLT